MRSPSLALTLFAALAAPRAARADPPTIALQGRLLGANGNPVAAEVTVHAALYAAADGGDPLWEEDYTLKPHDVLEGGIFRLNLGTPAGGKLTLDGIEWPTRVWIGIGVGDDAEMTPRLPLYDAPFALYAHALAQGAPGSGTVHTVTAGDGVAGGTFTNEGTLSLDFETGANAGSAATAARGDHAHDSAYLRAANLGPAAGGPNASGSTVDWSQLKGVPAAFADANDNLSTQAPLVDGSGLAISSGDAISVDLPGASTQTGFSTAVARGDHVHDLLYVAPDGPRTISGLKSFTATAPFALLSGAPKIAGLDADRVDGVDLAGLASGSLDCPAGQAVTGFESVSGQLRPKCAPVAGANDACSDASTVLYLKFDEASGNTAADCSANHTDFTLQGTGGTRVAGVSGTAVKLAGAAWLKVDSAPQLDAQNWSALTVSAWIKRDFPDRSEPLIDILTSTRSIYFGGSPAGAQLSTNLLGGTHSYGPIIGALAWHHVAVVVEKAGSLVRMYVDGNLAFSTTSSTGTGSTSGAKTIGHQVNGNGTPFSGLMDEFKVLNVARRPGEICADAGGIWNGGLCLPANPCAEAGLQLYLKFDESGGNAKDCTANAYDFTPTGAGVTRVLGVSGSAARFASGHSLGRAVASSLDMANWTTSTVSIWVRPDTTQSAYIYSDPNYELRLASGFIAANPLASSPQLFGPGLPLGQWSHVAAVADKSTGKESLYVNGNLVATGTVTPRSSPPIGNKSLGDANTGGNPFAGAVDEFKFYNRARTLSEICSDAGRAVCVGGGTSSQDPAPSCAQLKGTQPASPNGLYWLDPDGGGPVAPFQAWCDMDKGGWTLVSRMKAAENGHTDPGENNPPTASYGTSPSGSPASGTFGHAKINAIKALETTPDATLFRMVTCADRRYQDFQVQGAFASDGSIGQVRCQKHDGTWSAFYTPFGCSTRGCNTHLRGISDNDSTNAWRCQDGNWEIKHWTQGNGNGIYNAEGGCGDYNGELFMKEKENPALATRGLVSWWRFNGNANDSAFSDTGAGANPPNNGVAGSGITYPSQAGFEGNGFQSPSGWGTGAGTITVTGNAALQPTAAFTVETRVTNVSWGDGAKGGSQSIVLASGGGGMQLEQQFSQQTTMDLYVNGTSAYTTAGAVPLNTVTYLSWTYDGSNIRVYVNGSLNNTVAKTGAVNYSGGTNVYFSDRGTGDGINGLAAGSRVDFVRLYNVALSTAEIQSNYASGL